MHVKCILGHTPLSPVKFILRLIHVINKVDGIHGIRVMCPTPFPLIIFVLSVIRIVRVIHVIHVISPRPFTRINLVQSVMHIIRVVSPSYRHMLSFVIFIRVIYVICVLRLSSFPLSTYYSYFYA